MWAAASVGGGSRPPAGMPVALAVLPAVDGVRAAARARRLDALLGVQVTSCARVLDVVALPDGRTAVVSERVDGPTLAALRAARPAVAVEEIATVAAALGRGLAELHRLGVVHGDVSPANVVVRADGSPVLVDLAGEAGFESGTDGFRPPEQAGGAAAGAPGDVWAAATTALWNAPATARAAASAAFGPALRADPARRCGAADLVACAASLAPTSPLVVPDPPSLASASVRAGAAVDATQRASSARQRPRGTARPSGRRSARRRSRRRAGAGLSLAVLVVAMIGGAGTAALLTGGFAWPGSVGVEGPPVGSAATVGGRAASTPPAAVDALDIAEHEVEVAVEELVRARDAALAAGDGEALARLSVVGSPAAAADGDLLAALAETGSRAEGLVTTLTSLVVGAVRDGAAEAEVTAVQGSYTRSGPDGAVAVPAQPEACVRLLLERVEGRWLVRETALCAGTTG